jgi:diguanylate cyclase (GGDEF)-like protein
MNPRLKELKELIFASFTFKEESPQHTKTLILNAFLFITAIVAFISLIFNVIYASSSLLKGIDVFIICLMLYALYQLRKKKNYKTAVYIGVTTLFLAYVAIVTILQNKDFTIIWTYFFAPFAIVTLGAKRGLLITLFFLFTIFVCSSYGIDEWQNGLWNLSSYTRFVLAHLVMLYVVYAISNGYEKAYERIEALRQREQTQLRLFEKLSITDHLTSLYNRRSLKEIFPKEFYNAKRNDLYFAYFLLDIDYFKSYNDTYGHQKGDEALIAVANILNEKFKFAFRIGGDEFAGIMTCDKKDMIIDTIDTLHHTVKSLEIENKESPLGKLTCSIGVHIINEFEYDFEEIYNLADTALYKAKALGRDQVAYL